jgi:hypothetical protein
MKKVLFTVLIVLFGATAAFAQGSQQFGAGGQGMQYGGATESLGYGGYGTGYGAQTGLGQFGGTGQQFGAGGQGAEYAGQGTYGGGYGAQAGSGQFGGGYGQQFGQFGGQQFGQFGGQQFGGAYSGGTGAQGPIALEQAVSWVVNPSFSEWVLQFPQMVEGIAQYPYAAWIFYQQPYFKDWSQHYPYLALNVMASAMNWQAMSEPQKANFFRQYPNLRQYPAGFPMAQQGGTQAGAAGGGGQQQQ